MKRALVIQTAFLGDVILSLPVVQVLKRSFPESQVDFLSIPDTSGVLKSHPDISRVIVYDKHGKDRYFKALRRLRAELKGNEYDVVICPHRSLRSAFLARGTGAVVRVGFDRSAWKGGFTHVKPWRFGVHEVERNLSLLDPLGITPAREEPRLYPDEEDATVADRFLSIRGVNTPYAVVAPGTVWETKRYPVELMREVVVNLLSKFDKVVIIGGKKDLDVASGIAAADPRIVSAVGGLSFMVSAEVVRRASLLIANDSAPIHVASAFDIPTVAIFGPTVKEFGFYPYHKNSVVVEENGLRCRPCSIHGGRHCPIATFECMRKISPERVVKEGLIISGVSDRMEN